MKRGKRWRAARWAVAMSAAAALAVADAASPASPGPGRDIVTRAGPVLHEPIPPDPSEDLAMHAAVDGDVPAALMTGQGPIAAPDPRELPSPASAAYRAHPEDHFRPDRDTRPVNDTYDEPFAPSTAPFKRLSAFDAVRPDYELYVRNPGLTAVATGGSPGDDDDVFYMDIVVDLTAGPNVRIPSVGPGARVIRGRLGIGAQNFGYAVWHDGADNWFVQGREPSARARARLVMEVAIARAAFGGPLADVTWAEMAPAAPLPENVQREAAQVAAALGVSRLMRPREALARLVEYFRSFTESDEPPKHRGSVYLDLALSKKGVCRHRAFAFMVTALGIGIQARLVQNEAHAWVEVQDGRRWRRIDLGGAGQLTQVATEQPLAPAYRTPEDSFPWPAGAKRGSDALPGGSTPGQGPVAEGTRPAPSPPSPAPGKAMASASAKAPGSPSADPTVASPEDDRPASTVSLAVNDSSARRGLPLHARGEVRAGGQPCPSVAVELLLRHPQTRGLTLLGTLATASDGSFEGSVVVPPSSALGDYEIVARTAGDARCGPGQN